MKCRHCHCDLSLPFLDLGSAPPSNAYLTAAGLHRPEAWYPLRVLVCTGCWLVQTEDFAAADALFSDDYAYFSSFSESWLKHSEAYVEAMVQRFGLGTSSHVVELAANDGYLLQYVQARGIPCLGIEPTASTACAARDRGLEIIESFFGTSLGEALAAQGRGADLIVANNVLAHVPDINDFLTGVARLLQPAGVATFEFPHLLRLVEEAQFDTIYHEHFSYLSLTALMGILAKNHLAAFDVEHLSTHGGSLRLYAQRADAPHRDPSVRLESALAAEVSAGLQSEAFYAAFQPRAESIKHALLAFLLEARRSGLRVAAYGAAAKGNTLFNFAGVRPDLVSFVVDRNPAKQFKFLPGSRIPILPESALRDHQPDLVLLLPWNLREELLPQLAYVRAWGGRLVTAVPALQVH